MRASEMHGFATWPQASGTPSSSSYPGGIWPEKTLMRKGLLQPLTGVGRPPPLPASSQALAERLRPPVPLASASRPGTGGYDNASRPRTSGGSISQPSAPAAPLRDISFPSALDLRSAEEAPGARGPFSGRGDQVLPLAAQDMVRELLRCSKQCASSEAHVIPGNRFLVWAVQAEHDMAAAADENDSGVVAVVEPVAADRTDSVGLEVHPVELQIERRQASTSSSSVSPLRYGEGFSFRRVGVGKPQYLCHAGGEGFRWAAATLEERAVLPPPNSRFTAHGGELGAQLLHGRPTALQRLSSPRRVAQSPSQREESDSESDCSSSDCGSSESESERLLRRAARGAVAPSRRKTRQDLESRRKLNAAAEASSAAGMDGLFSRLADTQSGVFRVVLLPTSA